MTDAQFRGVATLVHLGLLPDDNYVASLMSANGRTSAVAFIFVCLVTGFVFFAKLP